MRIHVFYRSAAGAAELSRLTPALGVLVRLGHQVQVFGGPGSIPARGEAHIALGWDAVAEAAGAPTLHLVPGWEGLGAEAELLGRIEQVYRDPGLFRAVWDESLAGFLRERFGMEALLLPRGDQEAEARALESACQDMVRAAAVRRRYARALELAWDAKVAEIGPASPWGCVLLSGPARQVTVACSGEEAAVLAGVPKIRIARGGAGPWGLEQAAYDLVVYLAPHEGADHAQEIASAAALLAEGGTLVYGADAPEAREAASRHFGEVRKAGEGVLVCSPAAFAGTPGEKEEMSMSQSSGWGFQPPIEPTEPRRLEPAFPSATVRQTERDLDQVARALGNSVGKVHLTAAQALICTGDYQAALNHAEAAVVFGGRDAESLNTLGWLRYLEKDDQGALSAFEEALSRSPEHADVLYNQGMVCYSLGRREEAGRLWERSIRAGNAQPEVHNNLGVVRFAEGRTAEAADLFQRALQIDPSYGEARENLAGCRRAPAAGGWH